MRLFVVIPVLFAFVVKLSAQTSSQLDEKYGFRGVKLETPFNELKDLRLLKGSNGLKYYIKDDENLTEGDLEFQQIIYGFYSNRLYFIVIRTVGVQNGKALLEFLNDEYGQGQPNHNIADNYTWFAKKTGLVYEYKEIPEIAEAYLYSKTLFIEKRKIEKE